LLAIGAGLLTLAIVSPRKAFASAGVALGFWLLAGAITEIAERVRAFRAPWPEVRRRFGGLPRGAWGSSLAHFGLGLFILGACFETAWKIELAEVMDPGRRVPLGGYELTLDSVGVVDGPNYLAEQALLTVRKGGKVVCEARPERRFYPAGGQTTQEVAICYRGLDQVYITLGERRTTAQGAPAWLIRGYFNPWVQLIFLGPLLMALGGAVSLSDRRLRLAVGRKSQEAAA
jgi:cytochrome c-type biogenesis protein CcmF